MITMQMPKWFQSDGHKKHEQKAEEAVSRVVEAREAVTDAASRLARALDLTDGSRMEATLGRLVNARQVKR